MFESSLFKTDKKTGKQYITEADFVNFLSDTLKNKIEKPHEIINYISKEFLTSINDKIAKSVNKESHKSGFYFEPLKIAPEIKKKIETDNRDFLQDLLVHCDNEKIFKFWLDNGVRLTKDVAVSAVLLRSKKPILKVLYEKGCFDGMKEGNRRELFGKAIRLSEGSESERESFNYLGEILSEDQLTRNTL